MILLYDTMFRGKRKKNTGQTPGFFPSSKQPARREMIEWAGGLDNVGGA